MATPYGLALAAAGAEGKYVRATVKGWGKDKLADLAMSMFIVIGLDPNILAFFKNAAYVAGASPSMGGGDTEVLSAIKSGTLAEVAARIREKKGGEQPASATSIQVASASAATADESTSAVDTSHNNGPYASENERVGHQQAKQSICKDYWRGTTCQDDTCSRRHPPICSETACRGHRLPECTLFHLIPRVLRKKKTTTKPKSRENKSGYKNNKYGKDMGNAKGAGWRKPAPPTVAAFVRELRDSLLRVPPPPPATFLSRPPPPLPATTWPPPSMQPPPGVMPGVPFQGSANSVPVQHDLVALQAAVSEIAKWTQNLRSSYAAVAAKSGC